METDKDILYRYPGTKPFRSDEFQLFKGRDEDIKNLYELISIQNLIVLYGRSGLGKSSLLNAGLANKCKEENNVASLFIRFGGYYKGNQTAPLEKLTEIITGEHNVDFDNFLFQKLIPKEEIVTNRLWYLFKSLQIKNNSNSTFLLIFDQFEELFSYPQKDIIQFKKELAELFFVKVPQQLRNILKEKLQLDKSYLTGEETQLLFKPLSTKILFSIRSDKLSLLNNFTDYFPSVLKSCYELKPLSRAQAEQAITEPATLTDKNYKAPPYAFDSKALDLILDSLTTSKKSDGELHAEEKQEIETFQLQIICKYVENLVIKKPREIVSASDLGNLKEVFENHYINIINALSPQEQLPARKLIEEKLIIDGSRVCMPVPFIIKDMEGTGMTKQLIDALIDTHILRAEHNNSVEISHDTLIEPILKSLEKREIELQKNKWLRIRNIAITVLACSFIAAGVLLFKYISQQAEIENIASYKVQIDSLKTKASEVDTIRSSLDSVKKENLKLSEFVKADSALKTILTNWENKINKEVKIQFFSQIGGDSTCLSYLREQNYQNIVQIKAKATTPDHKPNGIFYGSNVDLTNLKVITLILIKAGIKLQRVAVIPDINKVQIINSSNNTRVPALTVDQILKAESREQLDKGSQLR